MGSLTSHPAVPAAAQTVYVPVYTPPASAATTPSATAAPAATAPDPATAARVRNTGLLERSRGVLSTVVTGFRGLLTDNNSTTPRRKTLLGE